MSTTEEELPLTQEEAEKMLVCLSKFYRQPVQPVSQYCAALQLWAGALRDRATRIREELYPETLLHRSDKEEDWDRAHKAHDAFLKEVKEVLAKKFDYREGNSPSPRERMLINWSDYSKYADNVTYVFKNIGKSNLLYRLIYCGEGLREEMCPIHKGKWNGQAMLNGCEHNCHGTGWLSKKPVTKSVTPLMMATITSQKASIHDPPGAKDPPPVEVNQAGVTSGRIDSSKENQSNVPRGDDNDSG